MGRLPVGVAPAVTPRRASCSFRDSIGVKGHGARRVSAYPEIIVTIDELLESARARLVRVPADRLEAEMAAGALVVDIRPSESRQRAGELPGAIVIERNVLEWRLCPASAARGVDVQDGQTVILVCNEGYQSSLAAATLQDLGVPGATDLVGGYNAWRAANPADPA